MPAISRLEAAGKGEVKDKTGGQRDYATPCPTATMMPGTARPAMIQPAVRGDQQLIEGASLPPPRDREGGDDQTPRGGDDGHPAPAGYASA